MKQQKVAMLYYASGIAAGDQGCQDGPKILKKSDFIQKSLIQGIQLLPIKSFKPRFHYSLLDLLRNQIFNFTSKRILAEKLSPLNEVSRMCNELAYSVKNVVKENQKFLVVGGDHSSAIGTWSGAKAALLPYKRLGLIWVDAHLDSHTFETTLSHNIHGMPLAALLGFGAKELIHLLSSAPHLYPEDVFILGVRSYEAAEYELLQKLNVRMYTVEELRQKSFPVVFSEILEYFQKNVEAFGLSVDLDGMDPKDIPGVGTPEANGIDPLEFLKAVKGIAQHPKFLGAEIAEFNPHHDIEKKTLNFIQALIKEIFYLG